MPRFVKTDNSYEFMAEQKETDEYYATKSYVYLSQNILVEEITEEDYNGDETEATYVSPLVDHKEMGLCFWANDTMTWEPVEDFVKKAYIDYMTEKEILTKKVEKNGTKRG